MLGGGERAGIVDHHKVANWGQNKRVLIETVIAKPQNDEYIALSMRCKGVLWADISLSPIY